MFVVLIGVEAGKPPACISSECESCSRRFAAWLQMNHLLARVVKARGAMEFMAADDGHELAEGLLGAFGSWLRSAAAENWTPAHMNVLRVTS